MTSVNPQLDATEAAFVARCAKHHGVDLTMIAENPDRDLVAIEDAIEAAYRAGAQSGIENFSKGLDMVKQA